MKNGLKKGFMGLCLTSAAFVFQACYGTGPDMGNDLYVMGTVKSKTTGEAIPGIKVSIADQIQYTLTDNAGFFNFYMPLSDTVRLRFEDVDEKRFGYYHTKDTVLTDFNDWSIQLDIELEDKE